MNREIERKFIVTGNFKSQASLSYSIEQCFLCGEPERTIRLRITDSKAFLTIKGKSSDDGLSREESELEIPPEKAKEMFRFASLPPIIKKRYIVPAEKGLIWEVDVFFGDNAGLVLAEIELAHEKQAFQKPVWTGKEVTGIVDFYNLMLAKHPINRHNKDFKQKYGII